MQQRRTCTPRPHSKHDTSDPVAALNALRTLLANTARTRFRMTADEHHQALRLLNAIEPCVHDGLSMATTLPNEILDAIAFHVDSCRDLLALALTCQRLHAVVCPRHIEYRVIRCRLSATHVWRHLAAHPLLARNVRRVYVMNERTKETEIVPSRTTEEKATDDTEDGLEMHKTQETLIVSALAQATALNVLSWASNSPLVSFDDIAPTVFACPSLREIDITDNILFGPVPDSQPDPPDLASVAIRSAQNTFRTVKQPSLARIQSLLTSHCPNLTTLRIGYDHRRPFIPRADDFLANARWPSLRILSLQNLWCSPHTGFDAASAFLAAHPLLHTLHFELGRVQLDLPPGTLPALRELVCGRDVAAAILACPVETSRPLEILRGMRIGGGRDVSFLTGLRQSPALRRVELLSYGEVDDVRKMAEVASRVTWLDVGKRSSGPAKTGAAAVPSVNEWAAVLSALPELTTLRGVPFFYEVADAEDAASHSDRSRIKKNDEVASMLAWKCPKLRRVDCWGAATSSGRVVLLGKEGEKFKWEVRRVKA